MSQTLLTIRDQDQDFLIRIELSVVNETLYIEIKSDNYKRKGQIQISQESTKVLVAYLNEIIPSLV